MEYPETRAAFDRVRAAAVEAMFATLPSEPEKREKTIRSLLARINNVMPQMVPRRCAIAWPEPK